KCRDVLQIAPKVPPRRVRNADAARPGDALFSLPAPRIPSRIAAWAEAFHPRAPEPLMLSASAVDNYRRCPQQYLFGHLWSLKEGPRATLSFGSVMHTTIKRLIGHLRRGVKLSFEEVTEIFETEWTPAGFED